jgi:SAM-dependent methyltransferase
VTDAVAGRVRRYILDGGDEDLRRLLGVSEVTAEHARRSFARAGAGAGWSVIDCGCGPIGALAVLAELVGPTGRAVGADFSEPAIRRAGAVVKALGLDNVNLVAGDIHELGCAALGGPFDLAFTRLFLMHQADPVRTLRQIAGLLRPGGWIVAHEPLRCPPPVSHPQLDSLATFWDFMHEVMERAGVPRGTVEGLPRSARAAGLEVVGADGFFISVDPELGFELHAGTIAAARERAAKSGLSVELVDDLVASLRAAKAGGYDWVTTPFFLDLVLRKPTD